MKKPFAFTAYFLAFIASLFLFFAEREIVFAVPRTTEELVECRDITEDRGHLETRTLVDNCRWVEHWMTVPTPVCEYQPPVKSCWWGKECVANGYCCEYAGIFPTKCWWGKECVADGYCCEYQSPVQSCWTEDRQVQLPSTYECDYHYPVVWVPNIVVLKHECSYRDKQVSESDPSMYCIKGKCFEKIKLPCFQNDPERRKSYKDVNRTYNTRGGFYSKCWKDESSLKSPSFCNEGICIQFHEGKPRINTFTYEKIGNDIRLWWEVEGATDLALEWSTSWGRERKLEKGNAIRTPYQTGEYILRDRDAPGDMSGVDTGDVCVKLYAFDINDGTDTREMCIKGENILGAIVGGVTKAISDALTKIGNCAKEIGSEIADRFSNPWTAALEIGSTALQMVANLGSAGQGTGNLFQAVCVPGMTALGTLVPGVGNAALYAIGSIMCPILEKGLWTGLDVLLCSLDIRNDFFNASNLQLAFNLATVDWGKFIKDLFTGFQNIGEFFKQMWTKPNIVLPPPTGSPILATVSRPPGVPLIGSGCAGGSPIGEACNKLMTLFNTTSGDTAGWTKVVPDGNQTKWLQAAGKAGEATIGPLGATITNGQAKEILNAGVDIEKLGRCLGKTGADTKNALFGDKVNVVANIIKFVNACSL